jgi:hypothetical protein
MLTAGNFLMKRICLLPVLGAILLLSPSLWAEQAEIIDKQNEYNGCTVEVVYDQTDLARERIDWVRSLHFFDYDWELRKAIDFYPNHKNQTDKTKARRIILFDAAGKEKCVTYYNADGQVIETITFE